jgi:ClpP class serine protease
VTWFLQDEVALEAREIQRKATPEQRERFGASAAARTQQQLATRSGATAEIRIEGLLTERPSFLAMLLGMGGTTYRDIRAALSSAASDPTVERVRLDIASPGGNITGLFELLGMLEVFSKPITVRASLAASAAFAIAAASGGRIEAVTKASSFGSIGVAAVLYRDEHVIDIASTDAPNKRPDPTTEQGKSVIRAELDALHTLFVETIARGRTRAGSATTPSQVNADFGRGGMLLAGEAKKRGMIDRIARVGESSDSEEAAVDRMHAMWAAVDSGSIRRLPHETKEQFTKRCVSLALDARDGVDDDAPAGATAGPDFGDAVAAAFEAKFPSRGATS